MTFEKAFEKIKEKFVNADASKAADFAMQITLADEDCGGTLYAAVKDGVLAVEPYDYRDNTSALNITKSALLAVLAGRISLNKAIENGEAFVSGNASDMAVLKSTVKKAPAVKAAPKKAAAKTEKSETKAAPKKAAVKTETKAAAKPETAPKTSAAKQAKPAAKSTAAKATAAKTTTSAKKTSK